MSTQRTNSVELDIAVTADLSAPSESLAASIPPELFKHILAYVGDDERLGNHHIFNTASPEHVSAVASRQDEMRHLSACALTCIYWAQLTRQRMSRRLILRSSEGMSSFLSFLRAPQSPRITPICDILRYLDVYYTLGDHPWFHNLVGLERNYRVSRLSGVDLHITGPASPAFVAASTRGFILHPLSFAVPRVFPVVFLENSYLRLFIENIHLPDSTMLFNLLQDCLSLQPRRINCTNLTWDLDPALQATPSSIGLKYAHRSAYWMWTLISRCTDNVLLAAMLKSVSHHESSQRRQSPYLSPLETSFLFNVMRTTWSGSSPERVQTEESRFRISSYSDFDAPAHRSIMVRRSPGTDFCLHWEVDALHFRCIASQLPHAPAASNNNVRNITYIIIDFHLFHNHHELRRHLKTVNIDWDTFLHAVRQFPHLRQIVIQWAGPPNSSPRQIPVEFLAHLGEAWFGLGELLGLYYREARGWDNSEEWIQLRLDTLMDEVKQTRAEIKAEADAEEAASNEPGPSVVEEESESSTHTGNE